MATIPVSGTAMPNATVEVEFDEVLADTVTANGSGAFSASVMGDVGAHTIRARQQVGGIYSDYSSLVHVTGRVPTIIADDSNTVAHLYVQDGVIKDTKSVSWTENGSVPRVGSTGLGFASKSAEGIGPFSAVNYLSIANPLLNFSGDFTITYIVDVGVCTGQSQAIVCAWDGTYGNPRHGYGGGRYDTGGGAKPMESLYYSQNYDGTSIGGGAMSAVDNSINVYSFGRAGASTVFAKLNSNTVTQVDITPVTISPSSLETWIGKGRTPNPGGGTTSPFLGKIFEIRATTTTPSTAVLNALHTAIMT